MLAGLLCFCRASQMDFKKTTRGTNLFDTDTVFIYLQYFVS